jgi:hypothetical protein
MKADLTNGRRETKEDEAGRKGSLSLSLSLISGPTQEKKNRVESIDHQNPESKNPEKYFSQFFQQIQTKATKPSQTHQSKNTTFLMQAFFSVFFLVLPSLRHNTEHRKKEKHKTHPH